MLATQVNCRIAGAHLLWSLVLGAGLGSLGCDPGERSGLARPSASASASAAAPAASARSDCGELAARLCAEFGKQTETCKMVDAQTKLFGSKRCAQMLARYDETVSELKRRAQAKQILVDPEQRTPHGPAPAFGPVDAELTMVEFSDFACADCGRGSGVARSVKNLHGNTVRFVFRHCPLPTDPRARLAAEASLAAHAQGKFWEYHDTLFANPHDLSRPALERYARVVGLDLPEFWRALDEKRYTGDVEADLELGRAMFVHKVPALFVNGERVRFPYGVAELGQVIAQARAAQ
jgi:protein-disulfide isomerase